MVLGNAVPRGFVRSLWLCLALVAAARADQVDDYVREKMSTQSESGTQHTCDP
jgi:uncharacterized membrane protein YebE (DUF533 family)